MLFRSDAVEETADSEDSAENITEGSEDMSPLSEDVASSDDQSISSQSEQDAYVPQSRTLDLPPPLRALIIAQMKAAPPNLLWPNPRQLNPDIPMTNSFGRPMPQSRIKNMKRKHFKMTQNVSLVNYNWRNIYG